jgi:hypothetical protein
LQIAITVDSVLFIFLRDKTAVTAVCCVYRFVINRL